MKTIATTKNPVVVALLVFSKSQLVLPITGKTEFWGQMLLSLLGPNFEDDVPKYLLPSAFFDA